MSLLKRVALCLLLGSVVAAQDATPRAFPPTADERRAIDARLTELKGRIEALAAKRADPALVADVAIYQKAAEYISRFPEEFFTASYVAETIAALDTGIARAKQLETGAAPWAAAKGNVVRGYVSRLDGSVQPYGLTIPTSYDGKKPMRLDIWLHGTQLQLNEVHFIAQQSKPHTTSQIAADDYIQLEPLGRMNLSYRYAGEVDVFEALASVQKRYNIDPKRILIRGHSMGGQGAWHLGLQHPGTWGAIESSAGYATTYTQARRAIKLPLPAYQLPTLHYYDAVDYALNAFNTPTVGYIGETDGNAGAYEVRAAWAKEGLRFDPETPYRFTTKDLTALFLIGPKTGHSWHPESKATSEAFIRKALESADAPRHHLRCVTYTTRFNQCHWLSIDGLDEHYTRADVEARRTPDLAKYTVTTRNVSRLSFRVPAASFSIDGQTLTAGANPAFERTQGRWAIAGAGSPQTLRKVHGLQGPIDDAFVEPFLLVRGTGQPWSPAVQEFARKRLQDFTGDFAKWVRGDAKVKDDSEVTEADIAGHNLILFGDPGSNSLIAKVLAKLPVQWTQSEVTLGTLKFPASTHVPVLVYPNPLNPARYVVINSGHTFSPNRTLATTESMFFPRLGDYAVMTTSGEVAVSGFFNETWGWK
jgi:hypothetical protein